MDKSIQMDLFEVGVFIKAFLSLTDFDSANTDMTSKQKNLVKYTKMHFSAELVEIAEQAPVDLSKCSVAYAEKYKWGQGYLLLSIAARILSNPRTRIWVASEDDHLRTVLFKLKTSFGEGDEGLSIIGKLFDPILASIKGNQTSPYRFQVMDVILKIIGHISFFDKMRFLGFVQETAMIEVKLAESGTVGVGNSRPYVLSYKEDGLIHKVAMGY